MQYQITRSPYEERTYALVTEDGTRYDFRDFELKKRLLNLGVGDSTIAAVLDMEPNVTMVVHVAKAA